MSDEQQVTPALETSPAERPSRRQDGRGRDKSAKNNNQARSDRKGRSGKGGKGRFANATTVPSELVSLTTCARCSFFVAGYRVLYGLDHLETVVKEKVQDGWLWLNWDWKMRELVFKSYGGRIDLESFHFAGLCSDCHRGYIFREGDPGTFCIEIEPGSGSLPDHFEDEDASRDSGIE